MVPPQALPCPLSTSSWLPLGLLAGSLAPSLQPSWHSLVLKAHTGPAAPTQLLPPTYKHPGAAQGLSSSRLPWSLCPVQHSAHPEPAVGPGMCSKVTCWASHLPLHFLSQWLSGVHLPSASGRSSSAPSEVPLPVNANLCPPGPWLGHLQQQAAL